MDVLLVVRRRGPGDPELVTLKALAPAARADVVITIVHSRIAARGVAGCRGVHRRRQGARRHAWASPRSTGCSRIRARRRGAWCGSRAAIRESSAASPRRSTPCARPPSISRSCPASPRHCAAARAGSRSPRAVTHRIARARHGPATTPAAAWRPRLGIAARAGATLVSICRCRGSSRSRPALTAMGRDERERALVVERAGSSTSAGCGPARRHRRALPRGRVAGRACCSSGPTVDSASVPLAVRHLTTAEGLSHARLLSAFTRPARPPLSRRRRWRRRGPQGARLLHGRARVTVVSPALVPALARPRRAGRVSIAPARSQGGCARCVLGRLGTCGRTWTTPSPRPHVATAALVNAVTARRAATSSTAPCCGAVNCRSPSPRGARRARPRDRRRLEPVVGASTRAGGERRPRASAARATASTPGRASRGERVVAPRSAPGALRGAPRLCRGARRTLGVEERPGCFGRAELWG